MAPDTLRQLLRRQPFEPFRLYTRDGRHYDVPSPDWLLVTNTTTALGVPGTPDAADNLILLANDQITTTVPASLVNPRE